MAIGMFFIPPLIILFFIKKFNPKMEWKTSFCFYFGWIPSNLISCWYLHYDIGVFNALMILFLCQVVQLGFVIIMAKSMVLIFGKRAFH